MVVRDPLQQKRYQESLRSSQDLKQPKELELGRVLEIQLDSIEDLIKITKQAECKVVFYKEPALSSGRGSLKFETILETNQGNLIQYTYIARITEEKPREGLKVPIFMCLEELRETYKDIDFIQATIKFLK